MENTVFSSNDKPIPIDRPVWAWSKYHQQWHRIEIDDCKINIDGRYDGSACSSNQASIILARNYSYWTEGSPPGDMDSGLEIDNWLRSVCVVSSKDEFIFRRGEDYFFVKKFFDDLGCETYFCIEYGSHRWPRELKTKEELNNALVFIGVLKG